MGGGNLGRVDNSLADLEDSISEVVGGAEDVLGDRDGWTRRQVDMMADLRS